MEHTRGPGDVAENDLVALQQEVVGAGSHVLSCRDAETRRRIMASTSTEIDPTAAYLFQLSMKQKYH